MGVLFWMVVFLCASWYAYKVVVLYRPGRGGGKQKLILLLPLLPLFIYLPWLPPSCHTRTLVATVLLWTAPVKLILLCLNTPLDPLPWISSSFSHFLVATFLPIRVSSLSGPPSAAPASSSYGTLGKLFLLIAILNIRLLYREMPDLLLDLLYCCQFYLAMELFYKALAAMVSRGFSVRLCLQFDEPLSSASLAEFWGRRWNLTVNSVLKASIYKPVLQRSLQRRGTDASKALATLAAFATSGFFHELTFVYVTHSKATGETTAFFVLHGLATVAEVAIAKRWPATRGMPRWMCRALTLSFLYATASFLFLRPLRRTCTRGLALSKFQYLQSTLFNSINPF